MQRTKSIKKETPYTQVVGQVVRSRRALLNIDQSTMAEALGITASSMSRLETGHTTMTIAQLRKVATALRTTPTDLVRSADALVKQLESSEITVTVT
jgi:transcriptional regulator with XRE-family HTH domain